MKSIEIKPIGPIDLDDDRSLDRHVVGAKAATLARLRAAGHDVPDGMTLSAASCAELTELFDDGDEERVTELRAMLSPVQDALGGGPLVVRSSAVEEDQADESFAGQFESVLGVDGPDALVAAVRTCLRSARSERVHAYGGEGREHALAVLIQPQLDADAAGVAFSADPVTGERGRTLVSAVPGLADKLASGEATPQEWVVVDGEASHVAGDAQALNGEQARRVADLAERLERELGSPQDVEWVLAGDRLAVVQTRPITALPRKPDLTIPTTGSWTKDQTHYPEPLTPFGASVYLPRLDAGIRQMCQDYGLLIEGVENISLGGEIYGHTVPVGGKEGPPPPWFVLAVVSRLLPPMRRRMRAAAEAIESGRLADAPRRWEENWRPEVSGAAEQLLAVDLAGVDDTALEDHLDRALDLLGRGQRLHFQLFPPYCVAVFELVETCHEVLGWDEHRALDLVAGLSEQSSAPARALVELAERVRVHPDAGPDTLAEGDVVANLREADPSLAQAFNDYLREYGHRSLGYDPGSPALVERPQLIATLLRQEIQAEERDVAGELSERRTTAERQAERALREAPAHDRQRFTEALARAQEVYPLREDNIFWTDNVPCGVIRRALLGIGRRLVDRGALRRPDDAAYLEHEEVRRALHGRSDDLRELVARRRAERAWVAAHPGPPFHGDEPADFPDVRGIPAAGRRVNGALLWMMGKEYQPSPVEATGDGLGGVPGSPGRYTGPVRVIRGEAEFDRLQPGEILVAPVTTPVWSVLFGQAGAVVTDGGGTLSHAAIVAREHGIPAVLATGDATTRLTDGQTVTVDGARGIVTPTAS